MSVAFGVGVIGFELKLVDIYVYIYLDVRCSLNLGICGTSSEEVSPGSDCNDEEHFSFMYLGK